MGNLSFAASSCLTYLYAVVMSDWAAQHSTLSAIAGLDVGGIHAVSGSLSDLFTDDDAR